MRKSRKNIEFYYLLFGAVITWLAVLLQFYLIIENRTASIPETIIRFFSFFTILTNTLVAFCFTILFRDTNSKLHRFFSRVDVLTAVSVYILIVGLVYQVMLRATWSPQGLQFLADELLHSIIPICFLIYWIVFVSKDGLQWKSIPSWLLYPSFYLIFIMIRGAFSGFYPYPFIDLTELTSVDAIMNCTVLLTLFSLMSACFILAGKRMQRPKSPLISS